MELNGMDLTSLPPLVFAFREGASDGFAKVANLETLIRPEGGLWTSPRSPTGSAWTDFLEAPDEVGLPSVHAGKYTGFVAVEVPADARIYMVDTMEDLDRLVATYPLKPGTRMHGTAPDWETMANDGWDAVYVSEAGIAANGQRIPGIGRPSLAQWDCASVLWLNETFRLVEL
ncbi:hypothetical protein ABUW04_35615 [Streptacidiphilus sp. N1-10]|uniref:RES domain-containing protein n=1 Tax=Streptacidiphilus jeojiensis TaxID=3229225 RepID=A0ABV6Y002_9ACTN